MLVHSLKTVWFFLEPFMLLCSQACDLFLPEKELSLSKCLETVTSFILSWKYSSLSVIIVRGVRIKIKGKIFKNRAILVNKYVFNPTGTKVVYSVEDHTRLIFNRLL